MSNLKPIHERAAILLASGKKGLEVAKELGVSPETVSRWKQNTEFVATCNQYRHELINETWDRLREAGPLAVETLSDAARFSKSDGVRVKAATALLGQLRLDAPHAYMTGIGSADPNPKASSILRYLNDY